MNKNKQKWNLEHDEVGGPPGEHDDGLVGQGGVHHPLVVQSEHVDPAVLGLVSLLPYVRQLATDNLYNLDLG